MRILDCQAWDKVSDITENVEEIKKNFDAVQIQPIQPHKGSDGPEGHGGVAEDELQAIHGDKIQLQQILLQRGGRPVQIHHWHRLQAEKRPA